VRGGRGYDLGGWGGLPVFYAFFHESCVVAAGRLIRRGGGWRVEGGGWRVEGGGWRVEGDTCCQQSREAHGLQNGVTRPEANAAKHYAKAVSFANGCTYPLNVVALHVAV
jgi:hypothetical protein